MIEIEQLSEAERAELVELCPFAVVDKLLRIHDQLQRELMRSYEENRDLRAELSALIMEHVL